VIQIGLEIHIDAPRDRVWNILTDHGAMAEWFPAREVVRRVPGADDPNGVGAHRVIRIAGLSIEEVVTAFKPCELLEYTVTDGAPFVDHMADVVLIREGDATRVRWSARMRPLIPGTGWLVRSNLTRTLEQALSGLKRKAEAV
jgi:uncharacterized protein YndB with AHSA1/START domain